MKRLQYALARYSMIAFMVALPVSLIAYLYQHREQSLSQLLYENQLLMLAASALAWFAARRNRRALLSSIDRLFFLHGHDPALRKEKDRVHAPPGLRLRAFARFFFSNKVYVEILEPSLRDLLDEYCEALNQGYQWRACWVRIRGYWAFCAAVIAQMPISALKLVYKIWKAIP